MREVQDHGAPITTEVREAFDTCVQCRGCEPACPSGVPYGRLIESTRETLTEAGELSAGKQKLVFAALARPRSVGPAEATSLATIGAGLGLLALLGLLLPRLFAIPLSAVLGLLALSLLARAARLRWGDRRAAACREDGQTYPPPP